MRFPTGQTGPCGSSKPTPRLIIENAIVSTILLYHSTFVINSLCHMFGKRRYETADTSRNSLLLALLTMGEGWHNNHHYYSTSVNQGFFWWEFDISFYILRLLSLFHLVWGLKTPPRHILEAAKT